MTAGKITLRTCNCCGEAKKSGEFSFTPPGGYAKRCRECGVWLYLLRQAFGPVRDWEANRERQRIRQRAAYRKKRDAPKQMLWDIWHKGTT